MYKKLFILLLYLQMFNISALSRWTTDAPQSTWGLGVNAAGGGVLTGLQNAPTHDFGLITQAQSVSIDIPQPGKQAIYSFIPTMNTPLANRKIQFLVQSFSLHKEPRGKGITPDVKKKLKRMKQLQKNQGIALIVYRNVQGESGWTMQQVLPVDPSISSVQKGDITILPDGKVAIGIVSHMPAVPLGANPATWAPPKTVTEKEQRDKAIREYEMRKAQNEKMQSKTITFDLGRP
jgi:hypothetical protein